MFSVLAQGMQAIYGELMPMHMAMAIHLFI